jgi:hypothetical protein
MKLAKYLVGFYGVAFLILGALFLVAPGALTATTQVALPTPVAVQEIRAVYGGFFLGVGLYLLLCALRVSGLRQGLVALVMIMGGLVIGRFFGFAIDGPANTQLYVLTASEVVGLVLALVLLRRVPNPFVAP